MILLPRPVKRLRIPWVALALAFFITSALEAEELDPVVHQPVAEDFSLTDLHGRTHRLSGYKGKVVLVSFWATWCPECIFEIPLLQALSDALPGHEFVVLAINVGEKQKPVLAFARQQKLSFPILLDQDMSVYKKWPVLGVPTSFLINQQGRTIYSVIGAIEWLSPATTSKIRALITIDQG